MALSKNALLLFCKPPIAGLVKTRLTEARGGSLTEVEAAEFFRCSVLDVAEVGMLALEDLAIMNEAERQNDPEAHERRYDFFISTISEEGIGMLKEIFDEDGPWSHKITYLMDKGASFDEHFDDAFDQIFSHGYENVVAIGGDLPLLPREHISEAFKWLDILAPQSPERYAFVQAPCQQSGVSIVGKTRTTPISASGIYYNQTGLPALDAYTDKLREIDIPNAFLNPVSDVDSDADLAHAISCLNAVAEASRYQTNIFLARRVLEWVDGMGLLVTAPPNEEHDPRQYIDLAG
jgi:uncharacterized protein